MATVMQSITSAAGFCVHSAVAVSSRGCCRVSTCSLSSSTPACSSGLPPIRPLISFSTNSSGNLSSAPSPNFASRHTPRHSCCEALPEPAPGTPAAKIKSILCMNCDGNGAVVCAQCNGEGLNSEDHFNGRFKAGTICWLCRGKKQILCGECNGAGFLGGFMNSQDD